MSNAWATAYKSYIDDKMQASTTISSSNVSSGSVGVISWTGAGCTYSSSRVNIEANGSITFTASPGYNITKIVIVSGSASAYYGTWTSSPFVTPKSESGTTTFEGLSANSVTVTTSTAFRCTSASYISIYYESASSTSACAIPTFSPEAGTYTSAQDVTINCATEDATIYYTTDGNDPTASSSIYSDPINVSETTTIKAIAVKDGMTNSAVATAEYVIKAGYVTLPFNWEGGASATLAALDGVTASGLGSDYAKDHAPYYVKFDSNGDYIQVKTDGQPGKVSIEVKMIGGANTSSITVQGSSDGEIFKDIETLSISGSQNDELTLTTTKGFEETDRYVRLVFTKGSNVGVGPISIAKPLSKHTATFYINGASSTAEIAEGSAITFPADPADINGKSFVGWTTAPINGTLDTAPETLVTSATMGTENVIYYAVFANVTPGTTQEVTDVLTRETTGASGTSYSNWSGKELSSSALYAVIVQVAIHLFN